MKRRRALLLVLMAVVLCVAGSSLWLWQAKRQYTLDRQLIAALFHLDTKQAIALMETGADPNTRVNPAPARLFTILLNHLLYHASLRVNDSPTAFMLACCIDWGVTSGRPVTAPPPAENLPLLMAMLAHGADVQARAFDNRTALHYAAASNQPRTVEWLLQHSANINAQTKSGNTPLMWANSNETVDVARLLLSRGANPNVQNAEGWTAMYFAVRSPMTESLLRELLAHGADPNLCNEYGETPITLAQKIGRPDWVRLLKCDGK